MSGKTAPVARWRFLATIYKIWVMRHVDVPEEIGRALEKESGKKKHIAVVAVVNGKSARTTLVPAGGGRYRLALNTELRKAAHADTGDVVSVELTLDRKSRAVAVPPDLRAALAKHPKARKAFEELPPGHRRQFILWFAAAKGPETRKRNIDRAIDHLVERALLRSPSRSGRRTSR
jgi:hypothetical protein